MWDQTQYVSSHLEFWTMVTVHKPSDSEHELLYSTLHELYSRKLSKTTNAPKYPTSGPWIGPEICNQDARVLVSTMSGITVYVNFTFGVYSGRPLFDILYNRAKL